MIKLSFKKYLLGKRAYTNLAFCVLLLPLRSSPFPALERGILKENRWKWPLIFPCRQQYKTTQLKIVYKKKISCTFKMHLIKNGGYRIFIGYVKKNYWILWKQISKDYSFWLIIFKLLIEIPDKNAGEIMVLKTTFVGNIISTML